MVWDPFSFKPPKAYIKALVHEQSVYCFIFQYHVASNCLDQRERKIMSWSFPDYESSLFVSTLLCFQVAAARELKIYTRNILLSNQDI